MGVRKRKKDSSFSLPRGIGHDVLYQQRTRATHPCLPSLFTMTCCAVSITSSTICELTMSESLFFTATAEDFKKIPGSPVAYWVSDKFKLIFSKGTPLYKISPAKIGMRTGDNSRFLRYWHEVGSNKISFCSKNAQESIDSKKKWFPYNKGGNFRKWYGNNEYLVNWHNNGYEIK